MRYRQSICAAAAALATAALLACGSTATLPPDALPPTAAQVWHRTAMRDVAISDAPDPVPRNEIVRLAAASYAGPGKIEARVYVLRSAEVGLELTQRWRPSADTVFFNSGPYFVVLKWQDAERQALQSFVRELEKRLGTGRRAS